LTKLDPLTNVATAILRGVLGQCTSLVFKIEVDILIFLKPELVKYRLLLFGGSYKNTSQNMKLMSKPKVEDYVVNFKLSQVRSDSS
jgi:hypothetical protein